MQNFKSSTTTVIELRFFMKKKKMMKKKKDEDDDESVKIIFTYLMRYFHSIFCIQLPNLDVLRR